MKILLDTCTFLWVIFGKKDLSENAEELFKGAGNKIFLSAVSSWEMTLKYGLGKLPLPVSPQQFIPEQREKHLITPLSIDEKSTLHLANMPDFHKDPFDRMLICQAIEHGLVVLTPDPLIKQYPVRTIW